MGRITVFTAEDINSKQLLKALEKRKLPYTEISVTDRPSRINDLRALDNGPTVPQAFFNSRSVGGLERCVKELKRWDRSSRFDTPLEKYQAEIASADDPDDKRLQLSTAGYKVVDPPPAPIQPHIVVKLPSGKAAPLREATELMKEACHALLEEHKYKGATHKNCFSGRAVLQALIKRLEIGEDKCKRFLQRLLAASVLHHVDQAAFPDDTGEFQDSAKEFYRLQCYETLEILNTYRLWPNSNRRDPVGVVEDLTKRLTTVELAGLDDEGMLDYKLARDNAAYCVLEDAVCEVQKFDLADLAELDDNALAAFCLNLYWVWLRYAYIKIGIPLSEADRKHFMGEIKFNLAGAVWSLQEWLDFVLKGKSSSSKAGNVKVKKRDLRMILALHMGAHNGSSWSSPFLRFSGANLDEELEVAACVYCREDRNVSIKSKDGKIRLSSLFKDYRSHFAKDGDKGILAVIQGFSTAKQSEEIQALLASKQALKISYVEPELGFHASAGPWYNQKGVQILHEQRAPRAATGRDPLGHSDHSLGSASGHSTLSWV